MSVFLVGFPIAMSKGLKKTPIFNSEVQRPVANRGVSGISFQPYATWGFEFDADRIQGNEALASSVLALFMGTHMACQGRAFPFFFTDPQDNTVAQGVSTMLNVTNGAATPMGTLGDGSSTQFQLARLIGGIGVDIIQNLNGAASVYVNGSLTAGVSISSN